MPDLYWQKPAQVAKPVALFPFSSEAEFERVVFDSSELFSDVYRLKRQVRGGNKTGIPDIVGVDQGGNVCIIEMKNTTVDEKVIPQLLQYAIWAETNPDSIRAMWLEAPSRPEDIEIDWDNLQIRVIVIAPSIEATTLQHINKIAFPTELIEVSRWRDAKNTFLLVNKLQAPEPRRVRAVTGLGNWEEEYVNLRDAAAVKEFFAVANQLQKLAKAEGWELERKYNKYYCGFKKGNFVVFGLKWTSRRAFTLIAKLPESQARRIRVPGETMHKYDKLWNEAVYKVDGGSKVSRFQPLLKAAVESRS